MEKPSAPATIRLSAIGGPIGEPYLVFALQDGFEDGYENKLESVEGIRSTHYVQVLYQGGHVDDITLELKLAVGASESISEPQHLIQIIECLYDLALPVRGMKQVGIVNMRVEGSGGVCWFSRDNIVKTIKVKFEYPWDIITGMPLRATVTLVLTPHYGRDADAAADASRLPCRPWKFGEHPGFTSSPSSTARAAGG